jgi:hypothetical protein
MKLVILLFCLFTILSCTDNSGSTTNNSYFKNDSGLEINIYLTENNPTINNKILNLKNGERNFLIIALHKM